VAGEWRKLCNEALHNLCCSPNVTMMIKSKMRWEEQEAGFEEMGNTQKILAK
jgi:hypothetical protein